MNINMNGFTSLQSFSFMNNLLHNCSFIRQIDKDTIYIAKDGRIIKVSTEKYINNNTLLKDMINDLRLTYKNL